LSDYRTVAGTPVAATAPTNHAGLSGLELAGAGVTWGHINDQPQTIAGAKTFSSDLSIGGAILNSPVYAHYTESAGLTISNTTVLRWDTKVEDTHNAVTTGSGWKFTAPIAGLYLVSCLYSINSGTFTAGNIYGFRGVFLDGSATNVKALSLENVDANVTKGMRFMASFTLRLTASQYFQIQALASTSVTQSNEAVFNWINIVRISS
jgi:hypothetical protein